jgi:Putative prokaryotic signal transducing protein
VSGPTDPEEIVTLVRFGELPAAQLLCGRLESEGIESFIPDEIMAAQAWHLNRAIGGIRVQVYQADLERAKQILEQPGMGEEAARAASAENLAGLGTGDLSDPDKDDDGSISPGDRAAYRSMRVALVSLWLLGLIHPYSLLLAVGALRQKDLTPWGRRRAVIALLVSLLGCAWIVLLVFRFMRAGR